MLTGDREMAAERRVGALARLLLWGIEKYQAEGGGQNLWVECNFTPSCSCYAKEAIERHGVLRGVKLSANRLRRCNQRGRIGTLSDPVPLVFQERGAVFSRREVEEVEESIRRRVRELPDAKKQEYFRLLQRKIRDPDTYAVLSYFFLLGLRHMYLGAWFRGILDFLLLCVGIILLIVGNWWGLLLLALIGTADLLALFRSQIIVREHNNEISLRLLDRL